MSDPELTSNGTSKPLELRQRAVLLAGVLVIACMVCWLQWRALASAKDTYRVAVQQLTQIRTDAARIQALQRVPKTATSRERTNDEPLAQVQRSLTAAGIDRSQWHDSIPQPPRRLPQSEYTTHATRLYLEGVRLREFAAFIHHLHVDDPTLRASAINLTNRKSDMPDYDVDLAVSYLVYAPQG